MDATRPEPWLDHDFVFVAGMHRSGTTLLANAVSNAAESSGLTGTDVRMDEGQFLQDVYPIGRTLGGVTRWAMDDRAYLDESDVRPDTAARLWDSWSPYWDLTARHLVEKTPLNLTKTRFLQAAFPAARFVVITRHPITQALAVRKWSPQRRRKWGVGFPDLVEHWVRAHEAFRRDADHLGNVHVVRFETLMADPHRELSRVQQFLGFPVDVAAAEWVDGGRAGGYPREWSDLVRHGGAVAGARGLANAVGKRLPPRKVLKAPIERVLFPRYAGTISRRFGARVRALGYDVDRLEIVTRWPAPAT